MKRLLLISAFLFAALPLSFPQASLKLTYRMLRNSRDIEALLNSDSVSMKITVRQRKEGDFILLCPPSLVADIGDLVHIWEIRDARVLTAMLDPLSDVRLFEGHVRGGNLKTVRDPSISPSFSGMAVCLPHIDIIALNPALNRRSPSAFGVLLGDGNAFLGIMHASREQSRTDRMQLDWRKGQSGRNMMFSIVGSGIESSFQDFRIRSFAYIQSAWDLLLGGGSTTCWALELDSDKVQASASRHLGGDGPNLKNGDEQARPFDVLYAGLVLKYNLRSLSMSYRSSLYEKPIYGGRSQIRTIELKSAFTFGSLTVEAEHSTDYQKDFGKVSETIYSLTAKGRDLSLKGRIELFRPRDGRPYLANGSVELSLAKAKLEVRDGRTAVELKMEKELDGCRMEIRIDQDRMVTASFRFEE